MHFFNKHSDFNDVFLCLYFNIFSSNGLLLAARSSNAKRHFFHSYNY